MPPYRHRTKTIILTGIAGRFGRLLAQHLRAEHNIIGIDPRGTATLPHDITVHTLDIRRRKTEDIFRRNTIDAVIHLSPTQAWSGKEKEHRNIAVLGLQKMLGYCEKYNVPKLIVLSSATVYGALPENDQFLTEEAALMGGHGFPALRDLIEVDMYATSFFWKHPEIDTVILRPVHIIGKLGNLQSRYLRQKYVPTLLGFDPMTQIIGPEDVILAIERSLKPGVRGVFNIAGPPPAPLSSIIQGIGSRPLPLFEPLARVAIAVAFGVGAADVPPAQLDFLKFVNMVDDSSARETLRYQHSLSFEETLQGLVD